ncbi:tyrosine-type recombinase/integrase [Halobacteriovorax sp. ZH1_bin.1]|uniref:tyrosine-type recombinase/integrase n=1 Tax=Halobacteriovorax sp. ZH1_bin.1 TaxID=3157723 RepID=UPI003713B4DA
MHEDDYGLNTISNYETCLKGNTNPVWGNKRISKITTSLIRNYFKEGRKKWSKSHTKNMVKYIKKVLDHAVEEGYIDRNPMPRLKIKNNSKLKTVLNEKQVKTLLFKARECRHPWYSIWATALFTGMRNGELYSLRWEDVSFDQNLINVCSSWNKHDGFKSTKNGDDRYVEISKPLKVILSELQLRNLDSEYVLPRIVKWDKGEQARVLREFLKEIELPEIRFHDTRACWATLMLSKGVEPIKLMKMGGWSDLKTMERYIRQAGVDIKGITACLDDLHDPLTSTGKILSIVRG